jgi:hypothetical protein
LSNATLESGDSDVECSRLGDGTRPAIGRLPAATANGAILDRRHLVRREKRIHRPTPRRERISYRRLAKALDSLARPGRKCTLQESSLPSKLKAAGPSVIPQRIARHLSAGSMTSRAGWMDDRPSSPPVPA